MVKLSDIHHDISKSLTPRAISLEATTKLYTHLSMERSDDAATNAKAFSDSDAKSASEKRESLCHKLADMMLLGRSSIDTKDEQKSIESAMSKNNLSYYTTGKQQSSLMVENDKAVISKVIDSHIGKVPAR